MKTHKVTRFRYNVLVGEITSQFEFLEEIVKAIAAEEESQEKQKSLKAIVKIVLNSKDLQKDERKRILKIARQSKKNRAVNLKGRDLLQRLSNCRNRGELTT